MSLQLHKLTYADGRAYQYHIVDETGRLQYVAERTGMLLPSPNALTEFFDAEHTLCARLQPQEGVPWQRVSHFELFIGPQPRAPQAVIIEERWRPVDETLLRLPMYELHLGEQLFVARGSRYGEYLYEIFRPCEEGEPATICEPADQPQADAERESPGEEIAVEAEETPGADQPLLPEVRIGQIERPSSGPSYIVEAIAAPLRQAVLPLAALAILIDVELYS